MLHFILDQTNCILQGSKGLGHLFDNMELLLPWTVRCDCACHLRTWDIVGKHASVMKAALIKSTKLKLFSMGLSPKATMSYTSCTKLVLYSCGHEQPPQADSTMDACPHDLPFIITQSERNARKRNDCFANYGWALTSRLRTQTTVCTGSAPSALICIWRFPDGRKRCVHHWWSLPPSCRAQTTAIHPDRLEESDTQLIWKGPTLKRKCAELNEACMEMPHVATCLKRFPAMS